MENPTMADILKSVELTKTEIDKIGVNVGILLVKMQMLEQMLTSNTAVASTKRTIKLAPTAAPNDEDDVSVASTNATPNNTTYIDGVINTTSFFKKIVLFRNHNDLKNEYTTQIKQAEEWYKSELERKAASGKKNSKKVLENSEDYWNAIGAHIWKSIFTEAEKSTIKNLYLTWKKENNPTNKSQLESE
jgi:hypothetical protein